MPTNVFVSYDHNDQAQVNGFKALKFNPNHPLDFQDHSLREPVTDRSGNPIVRPPNDGHRCVGVDWFLALFSHSKYPALLAGTRVPDNQRAAAVQRGERLAVSAPGDGSDGTFVPAHRP